MLRCAFVVALTLFRAALTFFRAALTLFRAVVVRRDFVVSCAQVKFEIPYFTVSGIQVRYLKIIEKSGYQALPWVR